MRMKLASTVLLTLALLAAGCGDDGNSGPTPFGPGAVGDANDVGDAASDILDGLTDGSLDEGSLEDLMESAQDLAESFGDPGSGTVTINGDTIEFTSEICFAGQGDFTIEGAGTASDGTPVWVSIDRTEESREELAEFLDEDMLQMLYGDDETIVTQQLSLEYGRTELFGDSPDDLPEFDASNAVAGDDNIQIVIDGRSASGSGSAVDYSGVSGDFSERFDFTFTASCG
ncbi:MAG: hypothetical protein R2707_00380 [Acidimicrobiales bacterium]